jgi:glycosyltransferase involved in cell wall biosynthesis
MRLRRRAGAGHALLVAKEGCVATLRQCLHRLSAGTFGRVYDFELATEGLCMAPCAVGDVPGDRTAPGSLGNAVPADARRLAATDDSRARAGMQSMRILHVTPYFAPAWDYGGPVRVSYEVLRRLVAMGHKVTVLTTDAHSLTSRRPVTDFPEDVEGIEVYRVRTISNWLAARRTLFIAPGTRRLLRRRIRDFDIAWLQDFYTPQNLWAATEARRAGVPYVMRPAGSLLSYRQQQQKALPKRAFALAGGRRMIAGAAALVVSSEAERDDRAGWPAQPQRVVLIPNGVCIEEVDDPPAPGQFRAELGIAPSRPMVLFAGRLHWIKGLDVLLQAFALLDDLPDAVLVVAGPDEGFLGTAHKLVADLGLGARVLFTGMLDRGRLLRAYTDADTMVLPTRSENFGITVLEACAMGAYVITTPACGFQRFRDWGAGDIVDCAADAVAGAIRRVLGDPEARQRARQRGPEMVRAEFTWERIAGKYEELLESIVTRRA